jgi:hypothetical protein
VAVRDWLPRLEPELRARAVPEGERSALATLALAVQRGLLLDLLADSGAHPEAWERHVDMMLSEHVTGSHPALPGATARGRGAR